MKKKPSPTFKEFPGWKIATNYRGFCGACGHLVSLGDAAYWRYSGSGIERRSVIRCSECVQDK